MGKGDGMGYLISDKQVLASAKERSTYRPYRAEVAGIRRTDESIGPGHPLYLSLCNIFTLENETEDALVYPFFPTGCVSLLFYEQEGVQQGRLCGATEEIKKLFLAPHDQCLVLRFMPGACAAFLTCEVGELTNRATDVEHYIRNGKRLQQIAERDIEVGLKALLAARVLRVEYSAKESDYLIHYCTEEILRREGNLTISELAGKAGFSERYIGKIFERYVGLSPKTCAEIIRFQKSLQGVLAPEPAAEESSLAMVAASCGYFDHAHMNRAYRRFAHCSSGALRRKGLAAIDFGEVASLVT